MQPDAPWPASFSPLLLAAAIFVLAGLVKGVVGMGLPTVAMGLLALLMPPAQAATLLIVPSLLTNLWQMRPWSGVAPLLRRLWPLLAGVVAGTLAGGWCFGGLGGPWSRIALGLTLAAYGAWGMARPRLVVPPRAEGWLGAVAGTATGLVTAATGVFVVPAVPFLQALRWEKRGPQAEAVEDKDALVQALGITFTASTLALAAILPSPAAGGSSTAAWAWSLAMLLPALAGMAAGSALRRSLSPAVFRRCFMVGLVLLGVHMVIAAAF